MTPVGEAHEFMLESPQDVKVDQRGKANANGEKTTTIDRFSIGGLAGIEVALNDLRAQGFTGFQARDRMTVTCVGIHQSEEYGMSDSPDFELKLDRERF
jgi:hypothetical protein